jgi:hypothetical protein
MKNIAVIILILLLTLEKTNAVNCKDDPNSDGKALPGGNNC